jgi:septal ring factor EnvC (AmiA/AmiB activator)
MTSPESPEAPVALTRHEFERLHAFLHSTSTSIHSIGGRQHQQTNRLHEIQQALDIHSGRLDRIEDNQGRQNQKLETIIELLREPQAADGK